MIENIIKSVAGRVAVADPAVDREDVQQDLWVEYLTNEEKYASMDEHLLRWLLFHRITHLYSLRPEINVHSIEALQGSFYYEDHVDDKIFTQQVLESIEPLKKSVLISHYILGVPTRELAKLHGISIRTVHEWLEHTLEYIRNNSLLLEGEDTS